MLPYTERLLNVDFGKRRKGLKLSICAYEGKRRELSGVGNEEMLKTVKYGRTLLGTLKRRKGNWIGRIGLSKAKGILTNVPEDTVHHGRRR